MNKISLKLKATRYGIAIFLVTLILSTPVTCPAQNREFPVEADYRISMIEAVVAKWEGVDETTSSARWQQGIRVWLQRLSTNQLESALTASSYDELVEILSRSNILLNTAAGIDQPLALGKAYYPLDPCRIVDTRYASGIFSGPIASDTVASYYARDGEDRSEVFAIQGGNAGGCGVPVDAEAVVVNITSTQQGGRGHLRAYRWGIDIPLSSILNFFPGYSVANSTILPLCTSACSYDFSIYASWASTHVVIDVMGYFDD